MQLRLLVLLALVCVPDCCMAQDTEPITLVESKLQVWGGFVGEPRVSGMKMVCDVSSKPVLESTTSQIILGLNDGYELKEVLAEAIPSLEFVDLLEKKLDGGKIELQFPTTAKSGNYRIAVTAQKKGVDRPAIKRLNVTIGTAPQPPPGPGPVPPQPDGDAPIKEPGLRVLITYESQLPVPKWLQDADWRTMLNTLCVTGPDGKTKEWRVVDKDSPSVANAGVWPAALEKMKGKEVPAILISNGKTGTITKLPESKDEAIALVKKYAEAK